MRNINRKIKSWRILLSIVRFKNDYYADKNIKIAQRTSETVNRDVAKKRDLTIRYIRIRD